MLANILRPSCANRWTKCTGYVKLAAQYAHESPKSDATNKGSLIHEYAAINAKLLFSKQQHFSFNVDDLKKLVRCVPAQNSQEYLDYVDFYINYLQKFLNPNEFGITANEQGCTQIVHVEEPLNMDKIYVGMRGTPDCVVVKLLNKCVLTVDIIDLKTGIQEVRSYQNPQLLLYALGVMYKYCFTTATQIRLHIVQKINGVDVSSVYSLNYNYLINFESKVKKVVNNICSWKFEYNEGSHCVYCPYKAFCAKKLNNVTEAVDQVYSNNMDNLSTQHLSRLLAICQEATTMAPRLKELLAKRLERGDVCNEYILKKRAAPMKWTNEDKFISQTILERLGDAAKNYLCEKPITATQFMRIASEEHKNIMREYMDKNEDTLIVERVFVSENLA